MCSFLLRLLTTCLSVFTKLIKTVEMFNYRKQHTQTKPTSKNQFYVILSNSYKMVMTYSYCFGEITVLKLSMVADS